MIDVTVTDDGELVATVDGLTGPALAIDAVEALAAKIPDAQNALARKDLTRSVRTLTDVFIGADASLNATVTINTQGLVATVDPATFTRLQAALDVTPDPTTGVLVSGLITVRPAS